jgi:hypothetical protein
MQKGVIHIAGVMGLLLLAALTLPRAGRDIEARLQSELDSDLARRGLTGIEGHFDGQNLTLTYARNAIDIIGTEDASQLAPRMAEAAQIAEGLTGGLDLPAGSAAFWGPVTRISVDQTSVNNLARQMEIRRSNARSYRPHEVLNLSGGLAFVEVP